MSVERWVARVAADEVFELGEGPVWDGPRERVLWVDVTAGTVHEGRLDGDRVVPTGSRRYDAFTGAVAVSAAGELVVAGERSLSYVGADGEVLAAVEILAEGTGRRLNDGGCDPAGRFLVGTLSLEGTRGGEVLVRVGRSGAVTVLDDDLLLSNGIAWSPDGGTLYSVDTVAGLIRSRPYDVASGRTGRRREAVRFEDGQNPDGMCVDAQGQLWVAHYGLGEVRRYTPDGELTGVVEVDAPHTTCPAFVGENLDRLLITTATENLSAEDLERHPSSGKLFLADVGVRGTPVPQWAGA